MIRPHDPASTPTGAPTTTRREFAAALGLTALTGVFGSRAADAADSATLIPDTPRELQPTGATWAVCWRMSSGSPAAIGPRTRF